jgi:hypothetical protein
MASLSRIIMRITFSINQFKFETKCNMEICQIEKSKLYVFWTAHCLLL